MGRFHIASSSSPTIKKNTLQPWLKKQWCIGQIDGAYLANMEEVLDVYNQVGSSTQPRLCFDERPCQLLGEVLAPLPPAPGEPLRQDYEYERKGTACVLLAYDLDTHQRYVQVREQRTKKDYAEFMDGLLKTHYPESQQIHLVQDNLNTHQAGSFYEWLAVERAHEMKNKLVFHYTPKHGSWLNMAEIEFSALAKQCLDRRIPTLEILQQEVVAWAKQRNEKKVKINWLFDTPKARTKLKRHYVKLNPKNNTIPNSHN
jgi:hypothetical protein